MLACLAEVETSPTTKTRQRFDLPLTPEEEYWAGFLHADGTISEKRNCVRFGQKDRCTVEAFHAFMGLKNKVYFSSKTSNFGPNPMYTAAAFGMSRRLLDLGIKRAPVDFLYESRHFWRGMIDGDGTVVLPSHNYPRIILCGNHDDIVAFSNWCARLFCYKGPKPYRHKSGTWYAGLGSGKAMLLGEYLYDGEYSAVPRKSSVALSFRDLTINHRAQISGGQS